jgi:hypothetical protein
MPNTLVSPAGTLHSPCVLSPQTATKFAARAFAANNAPSNIINQTPKWRNFMGNSTLSTFLRSNTVGKRAPHQAQTTPLIPLARMTDHKTQDDLIQKIFHLKNPFPPIATPQPHPHRALRVLISPITSPSA